MKNYRLLVTQSEKYSREFSIEATSEDDARARIREILHEQPLSDLKNTYDYCETEMEFLNEPKDWVGNPDRIEYWKDMAESLRDQLKLRDGMISNLNSRLNPDAGGTGHGDDSLSDADPGL
jgi:hypothetical protein